MVYSIREANISAKYPLPNFVGIAELSHYSYSLYELCRLNVAKREKGIVYNHKQGPEGFYQLRGEDYESGAARYFVVYAKRSFESYS